MCIESKDSALTMKKKEYLSAQEFYKKLGTSGLHKRVDQKHQNAYLRFLKKNLPPQGHILDCACGYGRLSIPLSYLGYQVRGIDISPDLIDEAKKRAESCQGTSVAFDLGDMRKLPYDDQSFDAVICMWSSFNELISRHDQDQALHEMMRVIKPGGTILIDVPYAAPRKPGRQYPFQILNASFVYM